MTELLPMRLQWLAYSVSMRVPSVTKVTLQLLEAFLSSTTSTSKLCSPHRKCVVAFADIVFELAECGERLKQTRWFYFSHSKFKASKTRSFSSRHRFSNNQKNFENLVNDHLTGPFLRALSDNGSRILPLKQELTLILHARINQQLKLYAKPQQFGNIDFKIEGLSG